MNPFQFQQKDPPRAKPQHLPPPATSFERNNVMVLQLYLVQLMWAKETHFICETENSILV